MVVLAIGRPIGTDAPAAGGPAPGVDGGAAALRITWQVVKVVFSVGP